MEKKPSNRLIQFLGGKTSYYVIGLTVLSASAIFIINKISFIFKPALTLIFTILPPVIFAVVIYYIFNPFVSWLEKKIQRKWAVTLVYVLTIILLGILGFFAIRALITEAQDLIKNFPTFLDQTQQTFETFIAHSSLKDQLEPLISSVKDASNDIFSTIGDNWQSGLSGLGNVFSAVSTTAMTLFVGPVIAFFLLKDKTQLFQAITAILPPNFRADFKMLAKKSDQQLGAFLKGQVLASAILGLMYWVSFLPIGLNYGTVIAFMAGILSIVPYIGSTITFVVGLIIALQQSLLEAVIFTVVWFAIQSLHGNLVMPRVMSNKLQIHFITTLLVLLVMGNLLGFIGVLFGIPIYTLVRILVQYLFERFKKRYNRFFADKGNYE